METGLERILTPIDLNNYYGIPVSIEHYRDQIVKEVGPLTQELSQ